MTEQDSTKLLFLFEQYRPEPHAVKASDTEMTNLPSDMRMADIVSKEHVTCHQKSVDGSSQTAI